MYLYILVTVLTVGLACLVDNRGMMAAGGEKSLLPGRRERMPGIGLPCPNRREGLTLLSLGGIGTALFLLSALRLEVGNDYGTYVDTIHEIYVGGYVVTEPLFNAVVKVLCGLSGGENYLLVFAAFALVTIWLFLQALYQQSEDFPLSFFLFMTLGIYFRTFNTMRYYFVLALALYSFRYLFRREYGKFALFIGLAALFHKSVLVVIPLYLIALRPWKKRHIMALTACGALLFLLRDQVMELALLLYPSYRNTIYLETETGISGNLTAIFRCLAVLALALWLYQGRIKGNEVNRFYFQLNLLALGVYVFASFLPLSGRIGYYLITSHILFIPSLLREGGEEGGKRKKGLTVAAIMVFSLYFLYFLATADQEGVRVLPYQSWLFFEKDFLNASEIF